MAGNNNLEVKSEVEQKNDNLKIIKTEKKVEEVKVPKMVALALDGFGNRVFVAEHKVEKFKKKNGL